MLLHFLRQLGVRFLVAGSLALGLLPVVAVPADAATGFGASAEASLVDFCGAGGDFYIAVNPVLAGGPGEQQYHLLLQSPCLSCMGERVLPAGAFIPTNDLSGAELTTEVCAGDALHITWVGVGIPQPLANAGFVGLRRDASATIAFASTSEQVTAALYEGLHL